MLFLAIRHIFSRPKQSILILLGIVVGSAAYVAISGMMLGFRYYIIDQLVNNDAQVKVSAREEPLTEHSLDREFFGEDALVNWVVPPSGRKDNAQIMYPQGWFDILEQDTRVQAYAPQLTIQSIVRRGKITQAGRLIGVKPDRQVGVTNINKYIEGGRLQDLGQTGNRVICGLEMLQKIGGRVSENIQVSVGKNKPMPFKVIAGFSTGVKIFDETTCFGALADVQKLNQTPSQISDIAIKLYNVDEAASVASGWASLSEDKVLSWDQANANILSVFKVQDIVRYSMTVSILLVAGFGIYNILSILVNQKRREIAILRSIGYDSTDIRSLFLSQGVMLGFVGGILGIGLGYVVCRYMATIPFSGGGMMKSGQTMMVSFDPRIYVQGFFMAFLSSSISSVLPARAAAHMTPIDIIRSEI
jgi:lipoprotein-releasing system permease protein